VCVYGIRTDVFGQILPHLGKDWSHSGIVELFANIKENGYEMLYLTARAIGQADLTRDYLSSLRQGDRKLPEGPILMSPDRLFSSLNRSASLFSLFFENCCTILICSPHLFVCAYSDGVLLIFFSREVILRKPEQFKIACLRDIVSLFPPNAKPFYAGFGNRETVLQNQTLFFTNYNDNH
jgi:phosphatidate phosphatase LPIN